MKIFAFIFSENDRLVITAMAFSDPCFTDNGSTEIPFFAVFSVSNFLIIAFFPRTY